MKDLHSSKTSKGLQVSLNGYLISSLDLSGFLGLELKESENTSSEFVIDINSTFQLTRFNQTQTLNPTDIETVKVMLDLINLKIKQINCHKTGELQVVLSDGSEIFVPDEGYETWHINKIYQERIKQTLVIGGVGQTTFYK